MNILNDRPEISLNFIIQSDLSGNTSSYEFSNLNTISNLIQRTLLDGPVYKQVLSEEGKKLLKHDIFFSSRPNLNTSCPIYHVDFNECDSVIRLPCDHIFIPEAIENWLINEKAECPVCRDKLPSTEVKMTKNEIFGIESEEENDEENNNNRVLSNLNYRRNNLRVSNPNSLFNRTRISSQNNTNLYDSDDDDDLAWAVMASMDSLAQENRNKEKRD